MLLSGKFSIPIRIFLVLIAIALAVLLHLSGMDWKIAAFLTSLGVLGAALTGAFYTFGLTMPFAFMLLLEMMSANNFVLTAFVASLTAAVIDVSLFILVKKQLEKNARELMKSLHQKVGEHNIVFSAIGFFMFGSPLPDELALAFMQISEIRPVRLGIIVFLAKFTTLMITYAAVKIV